MFEFSIARKYLVPKRRQLSVSLIALLSVTVISLVVWLVLVFLSVTDGIERGWLNKLTTLNGPLRITPTPEYFHSYYYKVDQYAQSSGFTLRSIGQKAAAINADPYDPASDMELPRRFPKPELDKSGALVDPVKCAYKALENLGVSFQDFEVGGAMIRMQMLRSPSRDLRDLQHNVLTQVAYVASIADRNPHLKELMLPPTTTDIEQVLLMSSIDYHGDTESVERLSSEISSGKLQEALKNIEIQNVKSAPYWQIPRELFPLNFHVPAKVLRQGNDIQGAIVHVLIGCPEKEKEGVLTAKNGSFSFTENSGKSTPLEASMAIVSEEPIVFDSRVLFSSKPRSFQDLRLSLKGKLGSLALKGETDMQGLRIAKAKASFPRKSIHDVYLPKQFQDSGILVGDHGHLSFSAQGASAVQEQRVPITVAGFYDPGIMSIGPKCLLAAPELVHSLNVANQSFLMDPSSSTGIQVWIKDLSKAKLVKADIEKALADQGVGQYWKVSTYHDYDFAKDLLLQFQSDKTLFTLIGIIILAVACCNIISLLVLLVNDKKKEIGILQAMGASSRSIAVIFAFCGAGMGILSSLIGVGAAMLTLHNIGSIANFLSFMQGHEMFNTMFYGNSLPNTLSAEALRFILIATPLLSLLAGLVPAIKACRLRPSAILRAET